MTTTVNPSPNPLKLRERIKLPRQHMPEQPADERPGTLQR